MMRSATAFLPDSMITFMNLERSTEPNFGSGRMSRLGTSRRRGIALPLFQLAPTDRRAPRAAIRTAHLLGDAKAPPPIWLLSLFRTLGAVLRARLLAILDALQVERAAHDVIAHARQVLDAAATHQHDAVLLQVVAFAADVRNDLEAVRQANLGNLGQRRIRLLRRRRVDAGADAAPLRAALERRRLRLDGLGLAAMADELIDRGHKDSIRSEAPGAGLRVPR